MVLKSCEDIDGGLPARLRMHMMINIIFDFIIGLVPFVGDIMDAAYKCNTRNAVILEKYLREKGARNASSQGTEADPSLPNAFDRYDPETQTKHGMGQLKSQKNRTDGSGGTGDLESGVVDHSARG